MGSIEKIGESARGYRHVVMDYYNECVSRYNDVLKVKSCTKKFLHENQPQSGEDPIEAHTVEARKAAMLAIPSPTARVQLLGQLNCDWVTQCCVRKEETPDHCTFGLDSSSRLCTRPVHFECVSWHRRHMPNSPTKRTFLLKFVGNITPNTNTGGKYTWSLWRELYLILPPSVTIFCFTRKAVCDHIKNNVPINNLGDYVVFSSNCFHQGYFNSDSDMVYVTAQLFGRSTIGIAYDQLTRSHTKQLDKKT